MPFRVVLTIPAASLLDEEECQRIGVELVTIPCHTEDELIDATKDADAILTFGLPFTRNVISKLDRCRLIHNYGTGYDGIDVQAATDHGICVSFPGDYSAEEVAEHTMALVLACARKLVRFDRAVREGKWDSYAKPEIRKIRPPMFLINGQTLGIVGLGRIGRRVVPKAKGFGLKVIAFDPYLSPRDFEEAGAESVSFDDLLKESDFVSINAALTDENRRMMGKEEFKRMKSTAYLINCARGEFVDEAALYTALKNGDIAGAGLDVVASTKGKGEIVSLTSPLLEKDNVVLTGHSAFFSAHSSFEQKRRFYEHLEQVFNGEWPTWLVNPEVKEKYMERWDTA